MHYDHNMYDIACTCMIITFMAADLNKNLLMRADSASLCWLRV